jgi:hypothetical protein
MFKFGENESGVKQQFHHPELETAQLDVVPLSDLNLEPITSMPEIQEDQIDSE